MKRDLAQLTQREHDVVIVGGGIFGICVAWDAALRGLSVAILERGDFGQAATANCFKMVHGGIRYLQHADVPRVREASRERNALLRIAPHLVHPLPFVLPTYGHGLKGKEILRGALNIYDLITWDRNQGIVDGTHRIPAGSVLSRRKCLELFPTLERPDLTGAVLFYEAQMYSPARLALAYLRSAIDSGASGANYVEATEFLRRGNRVTGVRARDTLSGRELEVRGKITVNAAGPWAGPLLATGLGLRLDPQPTFSRDAIFLVRGRLSGDFALGLPSISKDRDALLSRGNRHLFLVPWRNYTLLGVWHQVHRGALDRVELTAEELQGFIDEINGVYPAAELTLRDVAAYNSGLILFGDERQQADEHSYAKRSQVIDHAKAHAIESLVTVIGVRYTTSRGVAEHVIDMLFKKLGKKPPRAATATTAIHGGRIERFDEFLRDAVSNRPLGLAPETVRALVHNFGSAYSAVLKYAETNSSLAETLGDSGVIKAEVIHAVREEMAQRLSDVVFRRTDLGSAEFPGEPALATCAALMAKELGWDEYRVKMELEQTRAAFPHFAPPAKQRVVA
jgi:glycerol-3-phosphate dehydrogenase